jgi:hypothetical protein
VQSVELFKIPLRVNPFNLRVSASHKNPIRGTIPIIALLDYWITALIIIFASRSLNKFYKLIPEESPNWNGSPTLNP